MATISEKIKDHFDNKKYTRILRKVGNDEVEKSSGYIVAYSDSFLVLQIADNFKLYGYTVLPIAQIKTVRFNKADRYYNKIMIWEAESEKVGINYKIDLTNWKTIFSSIRRENLNVIVECEGYDDNTFNIGPITKITARNVYIYYFDAEGFFEATPTAIKLDNITLVQFDDRYINVFSKYLRRRKPKS